MGRQSFEAHTWNRQLYDWDVLMRDTPFWTQYTHDLMAHLSDRFCAQNTQQMNLNGRIHACNALVWTLFKRA